MNERAERLRFLPFTIGALLVLIAATVMIWLVHRFIASAPAPTKKVVQEIHVIRPPPPPPEAPPPPPPPEEKVDVHEPEPEPDPTPSNEPPPSDQLGLDAEGGAGGDAFGLVGHKGGRDLLGSGGSAFAWYAGLLKNEILDRLQEQKEARHGAYSAIVKVWVRSDGTVERARLAQSSGDKERDRAIEEALSHLNRISQGPPADMPQPISLRIVSRA
ncbi:MAG TPA: TonB family protein [Steroidobacteraceae bacterium]